MMLENDSSVHGCGVGAWRVKNDQGFYTEWEETITFLLQCLQRSAGFSGKREQLESP